MFVRTDLPLSKDGTSRLLPWIVGAMIYLCTMAMAGGLASNGLATAWQTQLTGVLTVQIPPPDGVSDTAKADAAERQAAILRVLKATPGVARTFAIDRDAAAGLLEPWLGNELISELPLPSLIDVRLHPGATIDLAELQARLDIEVAGVTVDDHDRWVGEVIEIAYMVEAFGALVLLLAAGVIGLSLIFAVRAAIAIHFNIIEIMHLIGARNTYIAKQFQWHAFRLTLVGGLVGCGFAVATLFWLSEIFQANEANIGAKSMLGHLQLSLNDWIALGCLPFAAAIFAMLVARITVSRRLARLP